MASNTKLTSAQKAAKTRSFKRSIASGRAKAAEIERCNWYAVRTEPGSQKPKREYAVERTALDKDGKPRGKGYRIVPSLNANMSAIETALEAEGFDCWMPAEKRLVRDRKHTDLWKVRRFALMVGYVFVKEPQDFGKLMDTPGVQDIVRNGNGEPIAIDFLDILMVRAAEAEADVEFDRRSRNARQTLRKNAKTDPRLKMLADKLDIAGEVTVPWEKLGTAA